MTATVFKTLCGSLPQNSPPEPFTTPTHSYYKALGYTAATYHYLESEATSHCIDITKADGPDVTVTSGGVINLLYKSRFPLQKICQTRHNIHSSWTN